MLDSNSEEAWGEMKMRPGMGVSLKRYSGEFQYGGEFMIASFKKKTPALQASYIIADHYVFAIFFAVALHESLEASEMCDFFPSPILFGPLSRV